jgi:hypothetical protein
VFHRRFLCWATCHTAEEHDIDFIRERLLEYVRLLPTLVIRIRLHLVIEWDLLVVAIWQKTDFMDPPSDAVGRSVSGFPANRPGEAYHRAVRAPRENPMIKMQILARALGRSSIPWFIGDSWSDLQYCINLLVGSYQ